MEKRKEPTAPLSKQGVILARKNSPDVRKLGKTKSRPPMTIWDEKREREGTECVQRVRVREPERRNKVGQSELHS